MKSTYEINFIYVNKLNEDQVTDGFVETISFKC